MAETEIKTTKEEKKLGLFARLKTKIEQMFDSKDLTFFGKIFMFDIYIMVISMIGTGIISIIKTLIAVSFTIINKNLTVKVLPTIGGLFIALFVISLIIFVLASIAEAVSIASDEKSLMERKDDEE